MTKRLILMRHAKSGWDDPMLDDFDRPLDARGRASAQAIGAWLVAKGYEPDAALSSSAVRTRETFEQLGLQIPVTFEEGLYLAPARVILKHLRACTSEVALIIGHNPGIGELAKSIVAAPPDHVQFFDYPTCSTLVCDFDINVWADAVSRSAQTVDFIVPRDLTD